MRKTGFVFPGQGSQKVGMLAQLGERHPIIHETFDEASEALTLVAGETMDLWDICQSDPAGTLDQTHVTQPALLTASVAIWRLWHRQGGEMPELLAGHSLGEYSALVCAGVFGLADAVQLVYQRGLYMQQAVPAGTGGMAAILGLDEKRIGELCEAVAQGEVVAPANINAPGQTVIAGTRAAVDRAIEACREAGAKRALPLNVSVPSHCALMKPAAEQLGRDLQNVAFREPALPVVQNINGRITKEPDEIRENLLKQLYLPVQWTETINCMRDFGIGKVVECGPGKVLGGLIKRIQPEIECYSSDEPQALNSALGLNPDVGS